MSIDEDFDEWQDQLEIIQSEVEFIQRRATDDQKIKALEDVRVAAKECYDALEKCRWIE